MTLLTLVISILFPAASAGELKGILLNNSGVKQLAEDKPLEAIDDFSKSLAELPFAGSVHFNLGNAFLLRRETEKALSEFAQAIRLSPGPSEVERETRFRALFNSAVAKTEEKKIDEALEFYQKTLGERSDSIETKTNMELLIQQQQQQGGGGENQDDKDQKEQKQDPKQSPKQDQKEPKDPKDGKDQKKDKQEKFDNPRSTPRPFKSGELSQEDVRRMLEEMKRQEEQIRARMMNEQAKDRPPDKDW